MRRLGYLALLACLALAGCGRTITDPTGGCWQKAARNDGSARVDTIGYFVRPDLSTVPLVVCIVGPITITLAP